MKIVVLICVCMTRSILIDTNKVGFMFCYNLFYVLIISLCVSICSKMHYPPLRCPTTVTAKPKTSRQKQNTSRQKQKPHGKTENPHGKIKDFTAKTKYLTAKANTHGKTKATVFCFCCEVFGFAVRYLVLAYQRKVETML